jgi:hypothetical protein
MNGIIGSNYINYKKNCFISNNKRLLDDISFVGSSIGMNCVCNQGFYQDGTIYFTLTISSSNTQHKTFRFTVQKVEESQYYGFELDSNHRYLDGSFFVHHNSNSKSKIVELFEKAFGDYCCKFPITLLTMKRAASNATTSELARAKGKRFASLQEPSEGEQINCGFMKELSGGDKIMARSLFKEPIEFVPQFKMALLCNDVPTFSQNDIGLWSRLEIVKFTSRFVENPNPENPNEFLRVNDLSEKMKSWKELFMAYLIDVHYTNYRQSNGESFVVPKEVKDFTQEMREKKGI